MLFTRPKAVRIYIIVDKALQTCGILAVGAGPGPAGAAAPPVRQAVQVEDGARGEDELAGPAAHPGRPQDGGRLGRPRPAGQTGRQGG